jgi:signal transduction histidine kinase
MTGGNARQMGHGQAGPAGQPRVAVSASPVRCYAGGAAGVLASARDVPEQARLQRALAAEQACHRAMTDSVQPGLQVDDTGPGVPGEGQPRLFTRFSRSAMAAEQEAQGAGPGLSIVKHATGAHGGSAAVTSAQGAGSTFTVRLPIRAPRADGRRGGGRGTAGT